MYQDELKAIKKSNRYRSRVIYDDFLYDFASNDYLGLATKKNLLQRAFDQIKRYNSHAPKSSQMVNGYHQIHKDFEEFLTRQNNFESAIVAGSGFLANLSLIEALPRKKDILILDEEYHASGILASKLVECEVVFFKHNSFEELEEILKNKKYKRAIIGVEGIYSMSGDMLESKIFDVVDSYENTVLIVDEAHSSGVIGDKLNGVFDYFGVTPKKNHVKMGTLGKAYGSYGAYILASNEIIEFLQNRAKALIYATAPSVFDIALAHQAMLYVLKNKEFIKEEIKNRQNLVSEIFSIKMDGLILPVNFKTSKDVLKAQEVLKDKGFLVGAIRPPTVKNPMLRIITKIDIDFEILKELFDSVIKLKRDMV
ncbi:aminotransferase class I/II-fold pyridoxal phosphate-dependent enzyme [Sulfurospirillum sp. 1307]